MKTTEYNLIKEAYDRLGLDINMSINIPVSDIKSDFVFDFDISLENIGLTWERINYDERYLHVPRSHPERHRGNVGPPGNKQHRWITGTRPTYLIWGAYSKIFHFISKCFRPVTVSGWVAELKYFSRDQLLHGDVLLVGGAWKKEIDINSMLRDYIINNGHIQILNQNKDE